MLKLFVLLVTTLASLNVVISQLGPEIFKEPWWCPPGWTFYSGNRQCYKRVLIKVDQPIALEVCRQEAAELASFHNQKEHDFVERQIVKLGERDWIGFETAILENGKIGTRSWTDGSNNSFAKPAELQGTQSKLRTPDAGKSCYYFYKRAEKTSNWIVETCNIKKIIDGFICKRPALAPKPPKAVCENETHTTGIIPDHTGTITPPIPETSPGRITPSKSPKTKTTPKTTTTGPPVTTPKAPSQITCEPGWVPYTDKEYGFVTKCFFFNKDFGMDDKHTWKEWRDKCPEDHKGSTLVTIANPDEEKAVFETATQFIKTRAIPPGKMTIWVGLERKDKTNRDNREGWKWIDQTPFTYKNWAKGEPDADTELCARLKIEMDDTRKFWGENCLEKLWGICQRSGYDHDNSA